MDGGAGLGDFLTVCCPSVRVLLVRDFGLGSLSFSASWSAPSLFGLVDSFESARFDGLCGGVKVCGLDNWFDFRLPLEEVSGVFGLGGLTEFCKLSAGEDDIFTQSK